MNTQITWHTIQTLEQIYHRPTQFGSLWKNGLKGLWHVAIAGLAASDEPRVWQSQDKQGDVLWHGYDPKTGQLVRRVSATELRAWLEERHYQTSFG